MRKEGGGGRGERGVKDAGGGGWKWVVGKDTGGERGRIQVAREREGVCVCRGRGKGEGGGVEYVVGRRAGRGRRSRQWHKPQQQCG